MPFSTKVICKALGLAILCLSGLLSACYGVDSDDDSGGGETGELSLWITDAPVPGVDRVDITITGVAIQPDSGDAIDIVLDEPLSIDLLGLVEEEELREQILDGYDLPEGRYTSITLVLDETRLFIEVNGSSLDLVIPDAEAGGLEVPFNVSVDDDTELDLTIDFDVRKSLRLVGDQYQLHPVLRIVRTELAGFLTGVVAEELIEDPDCENGLSDDDGNAVYVFEGQGSNVQDIQGNGGDPIATAEVKFDFSASQYEYVVPFLPEGSYRAAFTCDSALDDPDLDDLLNVLFPQAFDVEIGAEEIVVLDFE